jgi:hypothetical protein
MAEPIDEEQLCRDVADAQKRVDDAAGDIEDLETDAAGWPGADEIEALAAEAATALRSLSLVLSDYLRDSDG